MLKKIVLFFCIIQFGFAQKGPGGVGATDGTSSLKIWYDASRGVNLTGNLVNSITNQAGITDLDISEVGGQRPTLVPASVNGRDAISFSGGNRLQTGLTLTPSNFVSNQASSFVVNIADNTTQQSCVYTTSPLVGASRFANHIPWRGVVYFDIGTCCGANARLQVGGLPNLTTNFSVWSYGADPGSGKQLYRNGTLLQNRANSSTFTNHASYRFNLGGNVSGTQGYRGDVTEVIVFNQKVNNAQRIIIENYLAAKYGLNSSANNVYIHDDPVNGNYDYDVAGIGRLDALNQHTEAQGTGNVRFLAPSALDDNEFLLWGHDNGNYLFNATTNLPIKTRSRLGRTWRINERSTSGTPVDIGDVDIQFDLSGVGTIDINTLRLVVDSDNDGLFSDEYPLNILPTDLGGSVYAFEGVNSLQDGNRFTLTLIRYTVITNRNITNRVKQN